MRQKLLLLVLTHVLATANTFAGSALRATPERLSEYYPYALMSYLSELDLILSCDALEKQLFSIFRISYLGSRGINMVVDEKEIPANWRPHFIHMHHHADGAAHSNDNCLSGNQLVGKIAMPDSDITARVFIQTTDSAELPDRVIVAFAGERPKAIFRCLLSEPQTTGSCVVVKQHLQSISDLISDVKAEYPDHAIDVVGYSHSGALAQALIFASPLIDRAYIFNSYGVHPDWLNNNDADEKRQTRIHHAYIDGSFLHGQDYNPLSRYSRAQLPSHKVAGSSMALSATGLEPNLRQIYRMNHNDSWSDTLYNLLTGIWILHSKEAVLRTFEAQLGLDFPW